VTSNSFSERDFEQNSRHDNTIYGLSAFVGRYTQGNSIAQIKHTFIPNQKICLDRSYYRWTIQTDAPKDRTFVFGASEFTHSIDAEPLLHDEQKFSLANDLFFSPLSS